jgi:hypothetical protein
MASSAQFVDAFRNDASTLVNSDGTTYKTLIQAHVTNGSRLKSIFIASDDSADRIVQLALLVSAVSYPIGEVTIADGSGTNGVDPSVRGLDPVAMPALQSDGVNHYLDLAPGQVLQWRVKTAVTAAKTIYAVTEIGDL